jgi:Na+/serine symporter
MFPAIQLTDSGMVFVNLNIEMNVVWWNIRKSPRKLSDSTLLYATGKACLNCNESVQNVLSSENIRCFRM